MNKNQRTAYDHVDAIRAKTPCADCGALTWEDSLGRDHPIDFHHPNGLGLRGSRIGEMCAQGALIEQIDAEIARCIPLCRDCYVKRHAPKTEKPRILVKAANRIRPTEYAKLLKTEGKHPDGNSLYLVVKSPHSARWEFHMRIGGKLKSFWLGSAIGPAAVGLKRARELRAQTWLENRGKTVSDGQPRQGHSVAAGKTFTEVLTAWLAANPNRWATKGLKERRGLAKLSLASLDIAKITQADVLAALENETPRMHAFKRGWLADLFSFAKVQGWRGEDQANPARFDKDMLRGFAKVERGDGHAAIAWQDCPAVFAALPDTEIGRAVRFTALTAARAGEVEGATWKEIVSDNGNSAWVIPAERMKAGKAHRVPLNPQALALLGERGADDVRLFKKKLKNNAMLNTIKRVSPGSTVHGLRATFKTWAAENGKDRELTERSLAHDFGNKVESAYQRSDLFDRRRELMEEWARFVTG